MTPFFLHCMSPLLAQSGHGLVRCTCLLLTQSRHLCAAFWFRSALRSYVSDKAAEDKIFQCPRCEVVVLEAAAGRKRA